MNEKAYKFSVRDDTSFRVVEGSGSGNGICEVTIQNDLSDDVMFIYNGSNDILQMPEILQDYTFASDSHGTMHSNETVTINPIIIGGKTFILCGFNHLNPSDVSYGLSGGVELIGIITEENMAGFIAFNVTGNGSIRFYVEETPVDNGGTNAQKFKRNLNPQQA